MLNELKAADFKRSSILSMTAAVYKIAENNTRGSCRTAKVPSAPGEVGGYSDFCEGSCMITSWIQSVLCCLPVELHLHIQLGKVKAVAGDAHSDRFIEMCESKQRGVIG